MLMWVAGTPLMAPMYFIVASYTDEAPEYIWEGDPNGRNFRNAFFRDDVDILEEQFSVKGTDISLKLGDMFISGQVYNLSNDEVGAGAVIISRRGIDMTMVRLPEIYMDVDIVIHDGEYYITFDRYDKFYKLFEEFRNELLDMRLIK